MLGWMREKLGPIFIGIIIAFIAFVFVFYGVFNPKATRGIHEGAVAGTVNGEAITLGEFSRELNRRMEMLKSMTGGKVTEEQIKQFRLREMVFGELVNRKLIGQATQKQGMTASDEEVRLKISEMPVFQKNGKFDVEAYKQVLQANNYTAASFERMMREDLSLQQWGKYFRLRAKASDEEVKREFIFRNDKRNVKVVALTTESGRKGIKVDPGEIKKFLADSARVNLAKTRYEQRKETEYKNLPFDTVKEQIAEDILASEKTAEIRKINDRLADEILPLFSISKASDSKINALLKPYGIQVRETGFIPLQNQLLSGVGEGREWMKDAFAKKSPIDPKEGGKAKKYSSASGVAVALLIGAQSPDMSKFEAEKPKLMAEVSSKKERQMYEAWMRKLHEKAKIDPNPAVVNEGAAE